MATGACTASSTTVTTSPTDWAVGHGVCVFHGGAACTLDAPTLTGDGGSAHTYRLLALDGKGGFSVSAQISSDTSPTWSLVSGAVHYALYTDGYLSAILGTLSTSDDRPGPYADAEDNRATPGTLTWEAERRFGAGHVLMMNGRTYRCTKSPWDSLSYKNPPSWPTTLNGTVTDQHLTWAQEYVGVPAVEPTAGANRHLLTSVSAVGGSTITLADAVQVTGTLYLCHDDAAALQAACDAAESEGYLRLKPGTYRVWALDSATPTLLLDGLSLELHLTPRAEIRFHRTSIPTVTDTTTSTSYDVGVNNCEHMVIRGGRWSQHGMATAIQFDYDRYNNTFMLDHGSGWAPVFQDVEISGWPRIGSIEGKVAHRGQIVSAVFRNVRIRDYGGCGHTGCFYHHGQFEWTGGQIRSLQPYSSHGLYTNPDDWGNSYSFARFENVGKNALNLYSASAPDGTDTGELMSSVIGCTFKEIAENSVFFYQENTATAISGLAVIGNAYKRCNNSVTLKNADSCSVIGNFFCDQKQSISTVAGYGHCVVGNTFHDPDGPGNSTIAATSTKNLTIVANSWVWREQTASPVRVFEPENCERILFALNSASGWYASYPLYQTTGKDVAFIGNVFYTNRPTNARGPYFGESVSDVVSIGNIVDSEVSGVDTPFHVLGTGTMTANLTSGVALQSASVKTFGADAVDAGVVEARRRSRVHVRDASAIVTFRDLWDILDTIAEYT